MKYKLSLILLLLVLLITKAFAQVTITSADSVSCSNPCTVLTAHLEGDTPTNAGVTEDDIYSASIPIGFTFNYYGTNYTSCLLGANGTIDFNLSDAGSFDDWEILGPLAGNTNKYNNICGPWCDIDIFYTGTAIGTETYSTDGVAPNRKFSVTWCSCSMYSCGSQRLTSQIILYESTNVIEVHLTQKQICTGWNPDDGTDGGRGIIGVEAPQSMGGIACVAPGRDWTPPWGANDEAWRFTPQDTSSSVFYTVSSIAYAPIPYASSTLYWYNATTGAFAGTGDTLAVCPAGPTSYKCGALGCADTSFGYYTINFNPITVTPITTNPTHCGGSDGTITLTGLVPDSSCSITYSYNGGANTIIDTTVSASGSVTMIGDSSGNYENITVTEGQCTTAPITVSLDNPPISISSVTVDSVSACGVPNGSLILNGLYGGQLYSVTYDFNGTTQPSVVLAANSSGSVTIPNLGQGIYNNIFAALLSSPDSCITPAVGPDTIYAPPTPLGSIDSFVRPSQCGYYDGSIIMLALPPYATDTINYYFNSMPQTSFVTITDGDSSIHLPSLPVGSYSGFTVTIGICVYTITGSADLTAPSITSAFDTSIHLGCHGDTVYFNNTSSAYFNGTAVSPGPLYYVWSFGDGGSDTAADPYHVFLTQGTYTVSLVADNHYCWDTSSVTVSLLHPLFDSFTASTYIVCQDSAIQFANNSFGTTGMPIYYNWYFGDGATDTNANTAHSYSISGSYDVTLVAHDYVPCYDTFSAVVYSDTLSGINLLATDTVICAGTYITFTSLYSSIGNTGITWTFGDGDSIKNINPVSYAFNTSTEQTYTVTANAFYRACQDVSTSRVITVFPQPNINLGPDTSICAGSTAITIADNINGGNPAASWLWNTGQTTPAISVNTPGYYSVIVNVNNCYASDTVWVQNGCYMDIPNAFTPNNDGVNDYFYPRQFLTKGLTSFKMDIFNRWGQVIFETTSLDGVGWDGKLNGVDQPEGVYIYVIDGTFIDGQSEHHQGNITLLR